MTHPIVPHTEVRLRNKWHLGLLALSTTLLLLPMLLSPTFSSGFDLGFHLYNTQHYANEIRSGVFYPRWLGDWYGGYGAPVGIAYPPLTYYSTALLTLLGLPLFIALKIVVWASLFAGGVCMYELTKELTPPIGALIAALVYQALPQRMVNLYVDAVVPQYISYAWLPIILLLLIRCVRERKLAQHLALALAVAGLTLTHLLVAYMFAVVLIPFGVYLILQAERDHRAAVAMRVTMTVTLGIAIAAIYWLPAIAENQSMNPAWFAGGNGFGDYHTNFLITGFPAHNDRARNYLHLTAFLSLIVGGCVSIGVIDERGRRRGSRRILFGLIAILAFSLLMTLQVSTPIWQLLPQAAMIQFPSRWLTIAALPLALLIGYTIDRVWHTWQDSHAAHRLQRLLLPAMLAGSTGVMLLLSGVIIVRDYQPLPADLAKQLIGAQLLPMSLYDQIYTGEYRPQWSWGFDYKASAPVEREAAIRSDSPLSVVVRGWQSIRRDFAITASAATSIELRTFWFPGWRAEIDGKAAPISISQSGTLLVEIPAGVSQLTFAFGDTPVRSAASLVSAVAMLLVLILSAAKLITNRVRPCRRASTSRSASASNPAHD